LNSLDASYNIYRRAQREVSDLSNKIQQQKNKYFRLLGDAEEAELKIDDLTDRAFG